MSKNGLMTFPLQTLDEVVDVRSGKRLPKGHDFSDIETSHPYIRARDIRDGLITFDDPVYISEETHQVIKKYTVSTGDVCITIVGANVGDIGTVPEHLDGANLTENAVKLMNLKNLDSRYLKYILLSSELQRTMKLVAAGAAQPKLGLYKIKALEIPYPPFPIQKRIAGILSAYDDLIDNNNRRIALLEEAVHRLYREWFVHLRFPGYEYTPVVAGVPVGWEKRPLKDFGEVITGKTPSTKVAEYYDGDVPFIKTPDMHNQIFVLETAAKLTEMGANSQRNKFLPGKTIMVSCIGTLGVVAITSEPSQTNQQINSVILENPSYLYYCYFVLKSLKSILQALGSSGATMGNVNKHKFENMTLLKPSIPILTDFHEYAEPAFEQILNLQRMNLKLQEARDALLPRLMNGSLAV